MAGPMKIARQELKSGVVTRSSLGGKGSAQHGWSRSFLSYPSEASGSESSSNHPGSSSWGEGCAASHTCSLVTLQPCSETDTQRIETQADVQLSHEQRAIAHPAVPTHSGSQAGTSSTSSGSSSSTSMPELKAHRSRPCPSTVPPCLRLMRSSSAVAARKGSTGVCAGSSAPSW